MDSYPEELPRTTGPYAPLVIIHGGAGSITRAHLPPSLYERYRSSLQSYLESTQAVLEGRDNVRGNTGAAVNAVEAATYAVSLLEENPLFNCGKGSVFNTAGEIQMEASIAVSSINPKIPSSLPGHVKKSAAVSMITQTRHPILLAKEVLSMADQDIHHLDSHGVQGSVGLMHGHLSGEPIEQWGWQRGLEKKPKQCFWTRKRWDEHRRGLGLDYSDDAWKSALKNAGDHSDDEIHVTSDTHRSTPTFTDEDLHSYGHDLPSQGTVGAVCLDSWGNLAVATSTGGLTNKRPGRIGDTPTVGAGFWAESWDEEIQINLAAHHENARHSFSSSYQHHRQSPLQRFLNIKTPEQLSWLADCLPTVLSPTLSIDPQHQYSPLLQNPISKQPSFVPTLSSPALSSTTFRRRRAVALSGTGNGDSFLRTNAARTTAAIARFSGSSSKPSSSCPSHPFNLVTPQDKVSLSEAITLTSGRNGLLQQSAESRWNKGNGEGEGGIIGIEIFSSHSPKSLPKTEGYEGEKGVEVQVNVAFDFNCGGMWRAYYVDGRAKVMVFREEYV